MKIEVPITPPSLNKLFALEWRGRLKLKNEIKEIVGWTIKSRRRKQIMVPVNIKFTVFFKDKRKRDFDNYLGGAKYFIDGIKDAGIIPEDNSEVVKSITMNFKKGKENKTWIDITPRKYERV